MTCVGIDFSAVNDSTSICLTVRDEANSDMVVANYIFFPDKPYCLKDVKSMRDRHTNYAPVDEFWDIYDMAMKQFAELGKLRE